MGNDGRWDWRVAIAGMVKWKWLPNKRGRDFASEKGALEMVAGLVSLQDVISQTTQ